MREILEEKTVLQMEGRGTMTHCIRNHSWIAHVKQKLLHDFSMCTSREHCQTEVNFCASTDRELNTDFQVPKSEKKQIQIYASWGKNKQTNTMISGLKKSGVLVLFFFNVFVSQPERNFTWFSVI